jgi:hypothetical protein
MPDEISYDARVYRTEVYKGRRVTTYKVRWKVGGGLWKEGFRTAAQADSFRSALLTAARKGDAFNVNTGRPVAWERGKADTSWYEFACQYVDMKWKQASAKYRKDIARALTTASPALLADARGRPDDAIMRRARDAAARDQALAEMQRRDIARDQREAAEERRRARWSARKADRAAVIENEWLAAEAQTKGVMVNRRGREAGADPRSLFTGPESRARKYASEELLNYWEYHPRPTEAFFQGQDTRIGYGRRMLAPRRRMTSEEQAWRDRYERDIGWPIKVGRHAEAA